MQVINKANRLVIALMLARTSTAFVSAFSHHAAAAAVRRSIVPATASAFVNWQSHPTTSTSNVASRRWMSAEAPAEKTEEEKAAVNAAREARK